MSKLKIKSLCLIVFKGCAITQLQPSLIKVYEAKVRCLREKTYNRRIQQNSVTIQLNKVQRSNFTFRYTGHARRDAKALPCTRTRLHYIMLTRNFSLPSPLKQFPLLADNLRVARNRLRQLPTKFPCRGSKQ